MNFREVAIRAGKTFIQSFLGVLIPELCMVLSEALPDATFWTVSIPPLLCAALAAGISAAWNIVTVALTLDEQSVSESNYSVLEPYDRVMSFIDDFKLAASELNRSDFSADALGCYAIAVSELAAAANAEVNSISELLLADELSPLSEE